MILEGVVSIYNTLLIEMKKQEYPSWNHYSSAYVDCSGRGYFIGFSDKKKSCPLLMANIYFLGNNLSNNEFDDFVLYVEEVESDFKEFLSEQKCKNEWKKWVEQNLPSEVYHLVGYGDEVPKLVYIIPNKFRHFVPYENQHLFFFFD